MNVLKKVVFVIFTVVVSSSVFANDESGKEPEPFTVNVIESPAELREKSYQRILAAFEQMRIQNPESNNLELDILVYPPIGMDSLEAYDFLIGLVRDMPEGTISGFNYLKGSKSISARLNRAGVDYLHFLGVVDLSLDRVKETVN